MEEEEVITELINRIRELQSFFDKHDIRAWVMRCELTIQKIKKDRGNTKSVINNFIGAGMGSLSDLIIEKTNNNCNLHYSTYNNANQELQHLLNELYKVSGKTKNNYFKIIKSCLFR